MGSQFRRAISRLGDQVRKMGETLLLGSTLLFWNPQFNSLLYFAEQEVDVALIEVGIGGLLDTTNVITGSVSVITSVGAVIRRPWERREELQGKKQGGFLKWAVLLVNRSLCQKLHDKVLSKAGKGVEYRYMSMAKIFSRKQTSGLVTSPG